MTDLIVVGGGIMGAPAAFFAVSSGADVVVLAPGQPADAASHDAASHDAVFGAHYDETRLRWRIHRHAAEQTLADRSIALLAELESVSGTSISRPRPLLFVTQPGVGDAQMAARRRANLPGTDVLSSDLITGRWPQLSFPANAVGYVEPEPAGLIDPRAMVATFLASSGADVVTDAAESISVDGGGCRIRTKSGRVFESDRVLVSAGAFSSTPGLLPRALAFRLKTESVVFAHLDATQAAAYRDVPPMLVELEPGDVAEIYTAPPTMRVDGSWRMKLGANTVRDRWLTGGSEAAAWYQSGALSNPLPLLRQAMLGLLPDLDVTEWRSERCVTAYTPHGHPYIDELVRGRLYVAAGGNGQSAKWGPELGRLAAQLSLTGEWEDDLPADWFRAVDERCDAEWVGDDLLSER